MSARATMIAALLLSGTVAVAAAPRPVISPGDLPGRERERFIDPFPKPKTLEPVIVVPKQKAPRAKRSCGKTRQRC